MAVQQTRKSRARRDQRRSHDALTVKPLSVNELGETHLPHHISPNGYYKGRKVIKTKDSADSE